MPFQNHFPWLLPVTRGSNNSPARLHAAYIVRRARLTMTVIKAQSVFPFRRSFWPDVYCPACLLSETKRVFEHHPPFDRFSVSFDQLSTILRQELSLQEFFSDIRLVSSHFSLCNGNWKRKWRWLRVTIDCKGLLEISYRRKKGISIKAFIEGGRNNGEFRVFFFYKKMT